MPLHPTATRLFFTAWIVYCVHFSTNVVRESYLAMALGEKLSVRVDEYLGLHPDLFEIPGRGAYINNNPGASILGAVPYAIAAPAINLLLRLVPSLAAPKPPAVYDDPRPNRTPFMNAARARGLDVKLGLAALVMQVGLMAPFAAAMAVLVFRFLRRRLGSESRALWLALLYAFGTPIFFRTAFLNQNVIIAHLVLIAYVCMAGWRPRSKGEPIPDRNAVAVGALMGFAVLTDYSGVPFLLVFGAWLLVDAWRSGGGARAARVAAMYGLGGLGPLIILLSYQWAAFGNPIWPAQRYMPATPYSVRGWYGFTPPSVELLVGNLLDPRYGLFIFCPMLVAAFAAPFLRLERAEGAPSRSELAWIFLAFLGLYLFSSANQFANLQWNTGVRYMVPAVPLLFLATVPVLLRMPAWLRWTLIVPTLVVSWCVSMAREDVPRSLLQVFMTGFELPTLTVLRKMASGYAPFLAEGVSPLPLFCLVGVILWLVWRGHVREAAPARARSASRA